MTFHSFLTSGLERERVALRSKGLQEEGSAVGKSIGRRVGRSVSSARSPRGEHLQAVWEREGEGLALWLSSVCSRALKQFVYLPSAAKQPFLPRRPGRAPGRAVLGPRSSPSFSTSFFGKGQRSKSGNKRNLRSSNYTALSPSALSVCPAATRYSATPDGRKEGRKEGRRLSASPSAPVIRRRSPRRH